MDQQDGGARRKEGSTGLSRVPAQKRDQEVEGYQWDKGGQKERGTKMIAKGSSRKEGPGGWRGAEGK